MSDKDLLRALGEDVADDEVDIDEELVENEGVAPKMIRDRGQPTAQQRSMARPFCRWPRHP